MQAEPAEGSYRVDRHATWSIETSALSFHCMKAWLAWHLLQPFWIRSLQPFWIHSRLGGFWADRTWLFAYLESQLQPHHRLSRNGMTAASQWMHDIAFSQSADAGPMASIDSKKEQLHSQRTPSIASPATFCTSADPHHLHRICWPIVENSVIKNKPHQFYKLFLRLNLAWLKTLLDCPEIHRMFDDFWVIWNPQCNRIHGIQERRCICMILHEKREEVVPSHDEERQSKAEDLTFWLLVPFWFLVFSHFVDRFWIWVPSVFSWKLNV